MGDGVAELGGFGVEGGEGEGGEGGGEEVGGDGGRGGGHGLREDCLVFGRWWPGWFGWGEEFGRGTGCGGWWWWWRLEPVKIEQVLRVQRTPRRNWREGIGISQENPSARCDRVLPSKMLPSLRITSSGSMKVCKAWQAKVDFLPPPLYIYSPTKTKIRFEAFERNFIYQYC